MPPCKPIIILVNSVDAIMQWHNTESSMSSNERNDRNKFVINKKQIALKYKIQISILPTYNDINNETFLLDDIVWSYSLTRKLNKNEKIVSKKKNGKNEKNQYLPKSEKSTESDGRMNSNQELPSKFFFSSKFASIGLSTSNLFGRSSKSTKNKLIASSVDSYDTANVSENKKMPQNDSDFRKLRISENEDNDDNIEEDENENSDEEDDVNVQVFLQSLSPGSTYVVRVKVLAATGWSVWSEVSETFRTLSAP
jgi:hypothetical protein